MLPVRLYKGATFTSAVLIASYTFDAALSYIASYAVTGDNYFIVLLEDITCAPKSLSYSGKTVGITLMTDGVERIIQLASYGNLFTVNSGVTLTLENNVILKGRADNTSLIGISGAFIMHGGKISSNYAILGGGVHVLGTFTITMNGGEISGNSASHGGGVRIDNNGTFTMSGGKIIGNSASSSGGGVYSMGNNSTFTMSGGEISGNTVSSTYSYYGGGVYFSGNNSIFTKSATGGIITGYGNDTITGNKVVNRSGIIRSYSGQAVYISSIQRLENTVPANKALDSRQNGVAGGWTE